MEETITVSKPLAAEPMGQSLFISRGSKHGFWPLKEKSGQHRQLCGIIVLRHLLVLPICLADTASAVPPSTRGQCTTPYLFDCLSPGHTWLVGFKDLG